MGVSETDAVQFFRLESEEGFVPMEGINMRAVVGKQGMVNLIKMDANSELPLHSHPHEQLGFVIEGELILEADGVEHTMGPFDAWLVPSGVEHAGRTGPEGCVAVDMFIPVREDYLEAAATPMG